MKTKTLLTHLVVIVVSVIVAGGIASDLAKKQGKICVSKKMENSKNFFGLNRFAADVQWMLFIQYCGSINTVNAENAPIIYEKLNSILRKNPDFEQAYEMGAFMLSVEAPEKAVAILSRACENPRLSRSWKLPFLAGFISSHHMKEKDYAQAERFFQMACNMSSPPEPYVLSALIRAKSQKLLTRKTWKDGITVVDDKHAMLCSLIDYHSLSQKSYENPGADGVGVYPAGFGKITIPERMLSIAQELQTQYPDDQNIRKTLDKVKMDVFKSAHLCDKCFTPYLAGEKFCSHCSSQVEPFGVCLKCGELKRGKFCGNCGAE
jgi:hypothetical protein